MTKTIFNSAIKISDYDMVPRNPNGGKYNYVWTTDQGVVEEGFFAHNDTKKVLSQINCKYIGLVRRSMKRISVEDSSKFNVWTSHFQCGIDKDGNYMDEDDHLLAAPCPPFCGAGN